MACKELVAFIKTISPLVTPVAFEQVANAVDVANTSTKLSKHVPANTRSNAVPDESPPIVKVPSIETLESNSECPVTVNVEEARKASCT